MLLCFCVCCACLCLTKQDISDDDLLWSGSGSSRDESDNSFKKRAEPGSRTKDCRQRIGSYLYSDPTSATADKTAGQTFDKIVVGVER